MKVVAVYEDNHGMLAIVKDYQAGVRYLLNNEWIDETTEMQDEDNKYHLLTDFIGADWRSKCLVGVLTCLIPLWAASFQ